MRILRVTAIAPKILENGNVVLAHFDVAPVDGFICRMSLVRSGRDGPDLIWSRSGPQGPAVHVSPDIRSKLALAVRAELASLAAGALAA